MPALDIPLTAPEAAWKVTTAGGGAARMSVQPAAAGSVSLVAKTGAAGDHAQARLDDPVDLREFTDLRLTLSGDPPAGPGSFHLELSLGSTSLGPAANGNPWRRLLPLSSAPATIPVSLDDLPTAARRAVDRIRITCVDGSRPLTCRIGPLVAVRDSMLADVDAALIELLDEGVTVGGDPVPATFDAPTGDGPALRLANVAIRPAPTRAREAAVQSDYTPTGFALRAPRVPYDLTYQAWVEGGDRAAAAMVLDFALGRLAPRTTLTVAGAPAPVELVEPPGAVPGTPRQLTLAFVVRTSHRQPSVADRGVPPYQRVDVDVAHPGEAPGRAA